MKHRIRRPAAFVAAVAAALVVVAVAAGFSTSPSSSDKLSRGTISVGYGNNLTGFLAVHDKLISNGAKLAVAQINAKGGIGGKVKIKMNLQDTKSDPSASVQVANYFINKHVNIMVLPCNTDYQVAMAAVAHRAHQLMLSPCNGDPTVGNRTPEYWALGMGGNAQMAQLANYARLRKLKRVYVLDSNFLYLHLMAKYFKKAAPSRGISIIGTDNIPFGATGFPSDFAAQVQKIKNVHPAPQAIMTGLFSPFVDTFAKQLRAAGLKMPIIGSDGMDTTLNLTAGGSAVNGNGFTTFGYPNKGSATARFYAQFKRKFGASPDGSYPALGYDAIKTIEAAVLKAQSTKPSKLAAAFRSGLTIRGALGVSRFLGHNNHNAVAPVAVDQIRNGKFVLVMKSVPKNVPRP